MEPGRIVAELDVLQAEVAELKHLPAETAAELDALRKPRMKIDTSLFILPPIEAERKSAFLARAFILNVQAWLGVAFLLLAGCVSQKSLPSSTAEKESYLLISLPPHLIGKEEGILSLKLEFTGARVVAVRRVPYDWDFETHWEDGGHVTASGEARHFTARVTDARDMEDFLLIAVEAGTPEEALVSYAVKVSVVLGVPDPQGGYERKVHLARENLVTRPAARGAR